MRAQRLGDRLVRTHGDDLLGHHVAHLRGHVAEQQRRLDPETAQHILDARVQVSGTGGEDVLPADSRP